MAETDLQKSGLQVIRIAADEAELGVLTENAVLLDEVLGDTLNNDDVVQACVLSQDGRLLAEVKSFPFLPAYSGDVMARSDFWVTPEGEQVRMEKYHSSRLNTDLYELTLPVLTLQSGEVGEEIGFLFEDGTENGARRWETVGWVVLTLSSGRVDHKIGMLARGVLVWNLAILVIGILMVYGLVRIIVEPTRRLVQATRRITGGDLTSLVEVRSRDEIGDLAVSFNQMTVELKRSLDTLEEYNASLEIKVQDRTRELEATQNQLIQAEKLSALGQLVSGVAHELNNPLSGILGYSQLLLRGSIDGQARKGLERIEGEAHRCKKTVQNLQVFARKHQPQKKSVSIHAILESTLELRAYQLNVNDIQIVRKYDENLPRTLADFHQLQQVFLNLIINAHQAMGGVPQGVLTVETCRDGNQIQVSIGDNGPGIPPDIQSKIFDPFFTTKEVGQGTGLGLSICFGILKAHRGDIRLESAPGRTVFHVELPILEEAGERPHRLKPAASASVTRNGGAAILVVDDEKTVAEVLTEALAMDGHRVDTATNGVAALERIAANGYDLIISDLKMPGMGGEEFYRQVRERDSGLAGRIIFSTGDVASLETQRFLDRTGNPYLQKPFEISVIRGLVLQVLEGDRGDGSRSGPGSGPSS
jgi:signal transduction histidine kinase/CheY-like chemotaxis protein